MQLSRAIVVTLMLGGCAAAQQGLGPDDVDPEVRLPLRLSVVGLHATMLLIYGGQDHGTFLGCVTCERGDPQSIFNADGPFGSKTNRSSIWNAKGPYGDRTSPFSPWNPHGASPPLLKDEYDHAHGYFSANAAIAGRTTDPAMVRFLKIWSERLAE